MRVILAGLLLLLPVAGWAADKVQPLNIKVGLWETNISSKRSGAMPIPDDVLARLTPEQRARIEERMKSSNETVHNSTQKRCVTKEDLEKGFNFAQEKDCTHTVINSSSSKLETRLTCHGQDMEGNGTVSIEALSPENVKGVSDTTITSSGHTMKAHMTFTSKWLGACTKEDTH
jgi:hypothetical protein